MADEARAMLDALMGQDRNMSSIVAASSDGGNQTNWDSLRKKKSCYDKEICPLYCAWGSDLFELFTNTKSDLGPNPYEVRDDAREEYLSLPDHEKDRLGFERMLHRKLGDLVRSCDRIVMRNKEKLRQEIAKAARARGTNATRIDPVTDVSDDMIRDAAEIMADLELREEEVKVMLHDMLKIDQQWKTLWNTLQHLEQDLINRPDNDGDDDGNVGDNDDAHKADNPSDIVPSDTETHTDTGPESTNGPEPSVDGDKDSETNAKESKEDPQPSTKVTKEDPQPSKEAQEAKIKESKSKLYILSAEQQKIIAAISSLTSTIIVPLRDNLQNITKQLYYVKTDMSADKTVCEVSGNFMSFRDAEERIAAHYAGKQFVGWKMVRDKFLELEKKVRNSRMGGGAPSSGPPRGHGRGGYGPPSDQGRGRPGDRDRGGGSNGGYGGHGRRDDRSRSRDHKWERDGGGDNRRGDNRRGWR